MHLTLCINLVIATLFNEELHTKFEFWPLCIILIANNVVALKVISDANYVVGLFVAWILTGTIPVILGQKLWKKLNKTNKY